MLAEIVGSSGKVFAIERIPHLKEFGENNVAKYNFIKKGRVEFFLADGSGGLPKQAPFDRIIVAAAAEKMPQILKEQLALGGRLVIPIQNSIWLIVRQGENKFFEREFPGFAFVPLVKD